MKIEIKNCMHTRVKKIEKQKIVQNMCLADTKGFCTQNLIQIHSFILYINNNMQIYNK